VVLAGFMRILSAEFVAAFEGKIMNIHPSLLPKYPGLHTHRRVLEAKDPEHGVTVHFVTAELDAGPAIVQARVAVAPNDTEPSLFARVQVQEHHIYPLAVRWFCEGRLRCTQNQAWLDGRALREPVQYAAQEPALS
jgi:phosphoribosylglycinamide formyltransferase 1